MPSDYPLGQMSGAVPSAATRPQQLSRVELLEQRLSEVAQQHEMLAQRFHKLNEYLGTQF